MDGRRHRSRHLRVPAVHRWIQPAGDERIDHRDRGHAAGIDGQRDDGCTRHAGDSDAEQRLWRRSRLAGACRERVANNQLHSVHVRRQRDDADVDGHDAEHVGTYEFRLFPNNGYTVAATSPAITVN